MANTMLFRSLVGALIPRTDTRNEAGRTGVHVAAATGARAVRRDRLPEHDVLRER